MGKSTTAVAAAVTVAVVTMMGSAQAHAPERTATQAARTNSSDFEAKVVKLVNKKRVAHGCHKLKINAAVHRAAQRHTNKMADANELSHQLRHEPNLGRRLTNAGYTNWTWAGENIEYGSTTPKEVVQDWLSDRPHRQNILECHYKDTGVGYAEGSDGQPFWTQDFGRK